MTSTEDGIHLDGSILWLDSKNTGDISFLSNPQGATSRLASRVIATEETVRILEAFRKKPKALVCQYNRPFAIGPLNMELLPSGVGLGGASLWVETNNKKFLYAPNIQPLNSDICHHMQLRKADILVLSAHTPYNPENGTTRKKEKERLLEKIREELRLSRHPVIYCEPYATAPELTKYLSSNGIPVNLAPALHKINKIYESYGSTLGDYEQFNAEKATDAVTLFPLPQKGKEMRLSLPKRPIMSVVDNQAHSLGDGVFRKIENRFYIPSSCEGRDLKAIISQVDPDEIYIFGPYAKDYVRQLRSSAPEVKALFPRHLPSLF